MAQEAPLPRLPLDEPELAALHERFFGDALEAFEAKAVGPAAGRYMRQLKEGMTREYALLLASNATASGEFSGGGSRPVVSRNWRGRPAANGRQLSSRPTAVRRTPSTSPPRPLRLQKRRVLAW
jgi:hypothetical protein